VNTAAIIPAYNEEKTIGSVLEALKDSSYVDRIVVVSDGSEDRTADIARKQGAEVIELEVNQGKGGAIRAGLEYTDADFVLFLDADLIGLDFKHLKKLLEPVVNNETDMTIGLFDRGRLATDLAHKIAPYLSGQRAIRYEIIKDLLELKDAEYGLEALLTKHFQKNGYRYSEIVLHDITHIMKEEKMGFCQGFTQRIKMFWQVAKSMVRKI